MKSDLPKSQGYENQSFFKEHLRRTAVELYEWHLMLHYFWLSDHTHNILVQISGTPQNGENLFLCKECHKELMASGNYIIEDVIHDPKVDSFPPKIDDSRRMSIKNICDAEFQKESVMFFQEMMEEDKEPPCFPENPEKEYAIMYLLVNYESREDMELDNRNCFHLLSVEARCLSIIYEHFSEYREKLNVEDWDLFGDLNHLKEQVIGDCHEMIGYWKLSDEKKKFHSLNQKEKRNKRQTWGGLTKDQIKERDQRITDKFKNSKLTMSNFAKKKKDEFGLSETQIRTIIRPSKK